MLRNGSTDVVHVRPATEKNATKLRRWKTSAFKTEKKNENKKEQAEEEEEEWNRRQQASRVHILAGACGPWIVVVGLRLFGSPAVCRVSQSVGKTILRMSTTNDLKDNNTSPATTPGKTRILNCAREFTFKFNTFGRCVVFFLLAAECERIAWHRIYECIDEVDVDVEEANQAPA